MGSENKDNRTQLMAILNITPDSFSGDGLLLKNKDQIIQTCQSYIEDGADIFDVGGESSRPGSQQISEQEEIDRVAPVIEVISKNFSIPVSIDTYKSKVAKVALDLGAKIVNDISALNSDPLMAGLVFESGCQVILMHNSADTSKINRDSIVGTSYQGISSSDIIDQIKIDLKINIDIALKHGISSEKIIIDPGFGFGKTVKQNLEILSRLGELRSLGFPILSGPSRKSFIGHTLNLGPDERLEGSLAAFAVSVMHGASIIRAHDVKAASRIIKFVDAVKSYEDNKRIT